MASEPHDIQKELDILLGAIARDRGCSVDALPFELEIVARSALMAAYNKGFRRHRKLSEPSMPAAPAPPPPPPRVTNAGVYFHVVSKKDKEK